MENTGLVSNVKKSVKELSNHIKVEHKIYTNFLSLGLVQFTNFVLPLVTYPYLFRTIGVNRFGSVMYAFSVMVYLSAFADYGFNISGPRSIVINKNNPQLLSIIMSTILQTKLFLLLFCLSSIGLGVVFIPRLEKDILLYVWGGLYLIGSCVLPTWLFQGLEDMKHLTWINLLAKFGATGLIYLVIEAKSDYIYIVGIFGVANLVSGIIGIVYASKHYNLIFQWQKFSTILTELRNGWYYFLSSFSSVAFSSSTVLILGFFVIDDVVGKYSLAEKIVFAVWQLISIFSQATYPVLCRLATESHTSVVNFMRKFHLPFTILIMLICLLIALDADTMIEFATGMKQSETALLLRILSLFPIAVCLNVTAYQMLLVYQKQKYNAIIFNCSVVLNILLCVLMASLFGVIGMAWAAVLTQIAVALSLHLTLAAKFPEYGLVKGHW